MHTTTQNNSEYRDLSVAALIESPSNPRKRFDENGLNELAASFRSQGVLAPQNKKSESTPKIQQKRGLSPLLCFGRRNEIKHGTREPRLLQWQNRKSTHLWDARKAGKTDSRTHRHHITIKTVAMEESSSAAMDVDEPPIAPTNSPETLNCPKLSFSI